MQIENLRDLVTNALEDMKAIEITTIDVRGKTSITDFIVIASGTSSGPVRPVRRTCWPRCSTATPPSKRAENTGPGAHEGNGQAAVHAFRRMGAAPQNLAVPGPLQCHLVV